MNKKQLIVVWVVVGITVFILLIILPYKLLYKLFTGFIVWLIMYLVSKIETLSKKVMDLKEIIRYLEEKFNILNKIENNEGNPYNGHPFEEGWIQHELKWVIKERDKN